ncbi:MAG TPA: histidine kinase, partial [Bacteroidia bacterium]|nr:histidine kinase [Bacteroidia bacterium]
AVEKTRMRIAINLHDDVGSVLSSMSVYGEAAKRSLAENNLTRVNELLDKVGVNARETMSNMSDIVWTINPVNDTGEKLLNKMEAFASEVLDAAGIEFEFKVDEMLFKENFLMPVRQNIFYIFKEAVTNSVKHSGAKKFSTHVGISNHLLVIEIKDDGKGFDPDKKYKGNGLRNMKLRAEELNGNLAIKNSPVGCLLILSFIVLRPYQLKGK